MGKQIDAELVSRVAAAVEPGTDVLGLLCARRGFLDALADRGCRVLAIEYDAGAARLAATSSDRVLVADDLAQLDLSRELEGRRFDALVADLGYVASPKLALTTLKNYVREGGTIVAVGPNATFAQSAAAMLAGDDPDCPPEDSDRRLRRYTRQTLDRLLDESELLLGALYRHTPPPITLAELEDGAAQVRSELVRALLDDREARTEEFVLRAHVLPWPGLRWIQSRMRELLEANAAANQEIASVGQTLASLREVARSAIDRESEGRKLLLDAHEQLLARDTELAAAGALVQERTVWAKNLDRELKERNELIRELQATVQERSEWARRVDGELAAQSALAQRLDHELTERNKLVHTPQRMASEPTEVDQHPESELAEGSGPDA